MKSYWRKIKKTYVLELIPSELAVIVFGLTAAQTKESRVIRDALLDLSKTREPNEY